MTTARVADLFPWGADEIAASLASCPLGAFRVTAMRCEQLGQGRWWADLLGYRTDLRRPFTWPGLRLADGPPLVVELPPYLGALDPLQRESLTTLVRTIAEHGLAQVGTGAAPSFTVSVSQPDDVPAPGRVGGDRITPGDTFAVIYVHHAKRYRFAAGLAVGADVLDLGCGVGYGSRMLARVARSVTAVDISPEAVGHAASAYGAPGLRLGVADARSLPFRDGSFDLVVCFEMLEHVPEQAALLAEAARVLRPEGRLIISTPNRRFYADQPDPEGFHCALVELPEFRRLVEERFDRVELFSQPRFAGHPEITDEFEVTAGADEDREMFIALATAPRRPSPVRVRSAPATAEPRAVETSKLRIFTFNWHEPYLALLARAGHEWIVGDWRRQWNTAFRPLPANARLAGEAESVAMIEDRAIDLVICQTPDDVRWIEGRHVPILYLSHNVPANDDAGGDGEAARQLVGETLARRHGTFVTISDMKREQWGLGGEVIPPGIDLAEHGGYTGEVAAALTVANLLRERRHMLGAAELEAGLTDIAWHLVGTNPGLAAREAASWGELRAFYRSHRLYAHATLWPWEDGYNLALLEAMATGMPVVSWANPTSPISEGRNGFIAEDAEMFGHWCRRLLSDPDLACRIGTQARRTVAERFPLEPFVERWQAVIERAASGARGARSASGGRFGPHPGPAVGATASNGSVKAEAVTAPVTSARRRAGRQRVVLATAWTPISTSMYYERAFRAGHDVLTWGPSMDLETLGQWRAATEQHALKATGTADEKIRMLRGLSRPADLPSAGGQPSVRELIDRLPRGFRPDLFVWIDGGAGFLPMELERLDCPTVCLVGDSHTQLDWRLAYARHFSHVFMMFNRQHIPLFRGAGCERVDWLPAACDPQIHRAFEVAKAFDVVFVGQTMRQWHPDRVRLLERLMAAGFDVHVSTKILEEMALAFARGRIVFNRSLAGDLNMRVFEALATGSLLLTDRLTTDAGLDELLKDRVHLVCYDEETLEDLARHYLDRPAEGEAIARAGRQEVLAHHTYAHRVTTLLATVLGAEPDERPHASCIAVTGSPRSTPTAEGPIELPAYYRNERPEVVALVPAAARRVLDVGCAAGALGASLKRRGVEEVIGIETNPAAARAARRQLDHVLELDLEHAEELPLETQSIDCIVCADVLEHLRDPDRVLALLARYLAPGGTVVASVPNVRHASVITSLLVDGRWRYEDEGILDRTHLRFFTLPEIVELFAKAELRIDRLAGTRSPEPPAIDALADTVRRLGGDADRFRQEASVIQYLLTATAAVPAMTPAPVSAPAVSIVIPVHDRAEFTERCLQALAATADVATTEVIVVDNGSSDGTPALLAQPPRPVRVITNAENLGFARACNQGAQLASGALIVFLNNDTEPEPGWLQALSAAAGEPGVGIVGARLLYPATRRVQHAGLALGPDGIPEHLWRNVAEDDPRVTEPQDVAMVTGACLAIRRELFQALGGFDEHYVNGVEDVDLCLAAQRDGHRVRYEPRAVVLHHEGVTEGRFAAVTANLQRFFSKWSERLAAMPRRPAEDFGSLPGPTVAWEGSFFVHHSLAGINRAVCRELLAQGIDLTLTPFETDTIEPGRLTGGARLARLMNRPTKQPPAVRVRHRYPPDFSRRPGERLILIQPWEFGAAPVAWARAMIHDVDEVWVPSEFVRRSYVDGGVPAERVVVIPNGFDPEVFHPRATPLPLPTAKRFRFLYVGGSLHRKGIDVLLRAYTEEFSAADDVCLVIKDHAYYRHRLEGALATLREDRGRAEILYYFDDAMPEQMAGFYAAASCLVHPFRGEGFGLPLLEAMACGRPVIVTDAGPAREFCPEDVALFVPAATAPFAGPRVDDLETVGIPWLAEPDVAALRRAMRTAYEDPRGCAARGRRGAAHAHARYTWARIARQYAERLAFVMTRVVAAPPASAPEAADLSRRLAAVSALLRNDPDDVEGLVEAARCALLLDEIGGARSLLARVLAIDPDHEGARKAIDALDADAAPAGAGSLSAPAAPPADSRP